MKLQSNFESICSLMPEIAQIEKQVRVLNVPTTQISPLKASPMTIFEQTRREKTGVYVYNRSNVVRVVLTEEIYENLLIELEAFRKWQSVAKSKEKK